MMILMFIGGAPGSTAGGVKINSLALFLAYIKSLLLNAVLVDRMTGKLASRWCDEEHQYVEYYIPGTEPTEPCDSSGGRRFRIPRLR